MSADLSTINPEDELDLGAFGLQPFEGNLLIVDSGIEDTDNGRRWFIVMEPVDNEEAKEHLPGGQIKDGGFMTHVEREELVRIGISSLKRIFRSVLNRENGSLTALRGEMIYAQVSEDDNGYVRARRYGPARNA
jgi:hypothetical protein